jgi:colicin import membrane protein
MVNQPELELQLKVWKELAISKQMLMRAATDALKLDPNVSADDLKAALEAVIKKIAKAEADVVTARSEARQSITATEKKLAATEKALATAQATVTELQSAQENAGKQLASERTAAARELQKVKDRLAEQERALKAINTALSDTPENVIKKMNVLKKQKQEEADTRRQIEASLNTLRSEKRQQDQKLTDTVASATQLAKQYRELHELCTKLHEQAKPGAKDLPAVPELDAKLLEQIEQSEANGAASTNGQSAKNQSAKKK